MYYLLNTDFLKYLGHWVVSYMNYWLDHHPFALHPCCNLFEKSVTKPCLGPQIWVQIVLTCFKVSWRKILAGGSLGLTCWNILSWRIKSYYHLKNVHWHPPFRVQVTTYMILFDSLCSWTKAPVNDCPDGLARASQRNSTTRFVTKNPFQKQVILEI